MKIVIRFKGTEAYRIIRQAAEEAPTEGWWAQPVRISPRRVEIFTFSRKGHWIATTNGRVTLVRFEGYRGSFADGTCGFATCILPWKDAEIMRVETSQPDRPVVVYLGDGEFAQLPFKGKVGELKPIAA